MTSEIRVPVTTPGSQKAAQDLRGVQAAAQGVGKAEEQAARSTDKLTQSQKRLGEQSKATARTFQALGRGGGFAGGLAGRIGGGLGSAQLGALGPLAAGAAVAGVALMKLSEASNHAVERATALAKSISDMRNALNGAQQTGQRNRLSDFKENGQVMRRLLASGISVEQVQAMAGGHADAPEAVATLSGYSDFGKEGGRAETALEAAKVLKRLGITGSLGEGLGKLSEDRVGNAMGRGGNAVNTLLSEIIGESRGTGPASMDEVRGMRSRLRLSGDMAQLDKTDAALGGARLDRLGGAVSPEAAVAVMTDRAAWLDPITAALAEINRQQDAAIAAQQAAADAEFEVMGLLKDVFTPGGSFETQLRRAMNDRAVALNGVRP